MKLIAPFALALLASMPSAQLASGFAPGQALRDLELPTIDAAQTIRLSELRGQKLLLIQFASW